MKTQIKNLFYLPALITGLGLMLAAQVTAQTFTTLYSFTDGSDGAGPYGGLILSGKTLYGTSSGGGSSGKGTVFAVNTDGTGFTNLYGFTGGSDGAAPMAGLVLGGNTLYGTAPSGGTSGDGTVFAVNTDGTGFTNLYGFTGGSDGLLPRSGLVLSGNTLYGTAVYGGSSGDGTVFAVNTDGTGFTTLYSFTYGSDGALPYAGLVLSGNTLYGTAFRGGSSTYGTVFAVNTDGTGFTTLYSFTAETGSTPVLTNSDGATPTAGLALSGNTLYGMAAGGGTAGHGTVFTINTDGTGPTTLHTFTAGIGSSLALPSITNSDGAYPWAGLVLSGNTLYGTAVYGGSSGHGTVFAVNTDGTGFTTLYSFTGGSDGAKPWAGLALSGNTLFGTTELEGSAGYGTVFSLSLPAVSAPQLTITPSGANVILSWPATAAGFTLQSTTNLGSLAFWTTNSLAPVVVNGQNVVTNPLAGAQQFFRLSQ
jgi:uncharacterized repeat protein (TIGR03803 family)